ncbi:MAG: TonB-dependent receptor plug domain-containing protein [Gammaproteobacteria bacterium]|nr:TonB-dependent receptor plug domain-containing protein [Gammaproteobacteria bacterium]MBU1482255.1 TonB-dependent receptor plug domain-containing protein [Gammaproteobacteria bacterium]
MNKKIIAMSALPLVLSMSFVEIAYAAEDQVETPAVETTTNSQSATTAEESTADMQQVAPVTDAVVTPSETTPKLRKLSVSDQDNRLLKEMVVSANRDIPVQQRTELGKLTVYTPVSGSVVSEEELEHLQLVNNLLEIGKRVPGISMVRNMRIPDGGKQYTESRIDGMRTTSLNTSVFDTIDMSSIERIDVITGPASALYGTGALGGTISLTSRPAPESLEARVSQELGAWGYKRTQGFAGSSFSQGRVGLIVTGSQMDFDGWRKNSAPENSDSAAEHKNGKGIKAFLRPTETTRITVGYDELHYDYRWAGSVTMAQWQQDWRQTVAGAYGQSINDYTTKQVRLQQFIGDRGELSVAYGVIDNVSINYGSAGSGGSNNVICDDSGALTAPLVGTVKCRAVNNNSSAITNTLKSGTSKVVTKTILYRHEFDFAKTALHVGDDIFESTSESATYNNAYNALQAQSGYWAQGTMITGGEGSISKRIDSSPFVHVEMSPVDKVRVHLGERFARVTDKTDSRTSSNKDGEVTKKGNVLRSGVTYEFTQDHIVWGNLGETFNPPSVSSTQDTAVIGTPDRTLAADLNPERGLTREIGFRGRFDDSAFQYDVALYHLTINDFQTTRTCTTAEETALNSGVSCNINENSGQVTSKGIESMFSWAANDWLDMGATYTNARAYWDNYVSGTTDRTGQSYQALPRHHVNLRLAAKPAQGWQVELEGDYISAYFINTDNSYGTYSRPDMYTLRTSYRDKHWSFWFHIINLTNKEYATRVGLSTIAGVRNQVAVSAGQGNAGSYLPRTYRAGIAYNF